MKEPHAFLEEKGHLPFVCISDDFLDAVKSGRVKVRGRVKEALR